MQGVESRVDESKTIKPDKIPFACNDSVTQPTPCRAHDCLELVDSFDCQDMCLL